MRDAGPEPAVEARVGGGEGEGRPEPRGRGVPSSPQAHVEDPDHLVVRRIRHGFWLIIGSLTLFSVVNLIRDADLLVPLYLLKVVQIGAVAAAMWAIDRVPTRSRAVGLGVAMVALVCVLTSVSSGIRGDVATAPLLFVLIALVTSILIPWGLVEQIAIVAIAGVTSGLHLWLLMDSSPTMSVYLFAAGGVTLLVSTYLAYELDRNRRATAESRRSFEALVNSIGGVVWEADARTFRFQFVSKQAEHLLGYSTDRWLNEPDFWPQHLHPDDREWVVAECKRETREKRDHDLAYRMVAADGRTVWVRDIVTVVVEDGEPVKLRGVIIDVTETQRAEEKTAVLLDVVKDISGTLDLDQIVGRVESRTAEALPCHAVATFFWNPQRAAFEMLSQHGIPEDRLSAERPPAFVPETATAERVLNGETVLIGDIRVEPGLSQEVVALGFTAAIAVPLIVRGWVPGVLVALRAGDEFDEAQVELCEGIGRQLAIAIQSCELFRDQQEAAQIAGVLLRVSQEMLSSLNTPALSERLSQLTVEALGCDYSHTFLWEPEEEVYVPVAGHGDSPEVWESFRLLRIPADMISALLARLERDGLAQYTQDDHEDPLSVAMAHKYGVTVLLCVALRRAGEIVGVLSAGYRGRTDRLDRQQERIARGISQVASLALENARLVERLERASRLKSEFVATMSHELRTPLNVIIGYNDLMREGAFGPVTGEQENTLRRVDHNARQLLELINATLDLSRLESGRALLEVSDVSVADLLSEIEGETEPLLAEKDEVRFLTEVGADLPVLQTDRAKLKVILKNLIGNAVKFTDRGQISVSGSREDGGVSFSVADTGVGIPAESIPIIFEPFRQVDGSTTRRHGGVGLGMYIVRRLVDMLRGSVAVESEVGSGSTFRVWIPSGEDAAETERAPTALRNVAA